MKHNSAVSGRIITHRQVRPATGKVDYFARFVLPGEGDVVLAYERSEVSRISAIGILVARLCQQYGDLYIISMHHEGM